MNDTEKINILMADDRPENLQALEAILKSPNLNLVRAESGKEVLKCLMKKDFAVILLDVQMPGMDGFETARIIREREKTKDTPIIFLTAIRKEEVEVFTGYSIGAVDYMIKPIVPEILKSKVAVFSDLYRKTMKIKSQAAQLEQLNLDLKSTNEELEAFSYSVSHDLRAPLRSVDGFSRILLEDYSAVLDDDGKKYLNRIRDNAVKMAELIDALLQLSRVIRSDINRTSFDLSAMAADVSCTYMENTGGRTVNLDIEPGLTIKGDKKLLRIVLDNLIGNAFKYSSKTDDARIEFGTEKNHPALKETIYHVRDNGVGFNPEYTGKLFTPFQRLHSQTEFPGCGIGLATVHRIIRRHGGKVWAEGSIGKGACFYFTIETAGT